MNNNVSRSLKSEVVTMSLLAFLVFPIIMAMCVGGYGLIVWLLQMFVIGLPGT